MKISDFASDRENNFNFIRILAAFAVLFSHSFDLAGGRRDPLEGVIGLSIGSIAVDVFFLISGFLVTSSLLTKQSLVEYAWARALRIYPALITAVVLTVFGLGLLFTSLPSVTYLNSAKTMNYLWRCASVLEGADFNLPGVFLSNPGSHSVNGSLWTLPIELQMYGLLIVYWALSRVIEATAAREKVAPAILCILACVWRTAYWQGLGMVLFAILAACFSAASTNSIKSVALKDIMRAIPIVVFLTFSAYGEFGMNGSICTLIAACLVAGTTRSMNLSSIEMSILIAALGSHIFGMAHPDPNGFLNFFCMFTTGAAFWILRQLIPLLRTCFWAAVAAIGLSSLISSQVFHATYALSIAYVVFYLAYVPNGFVRKFNNFGDYSYGVYIYAFPIQQSILALKIGVSVLPLAILSAICALLMAALSWHTIEKPALRSKAKWVERTRKALTGKCFELVR